MFYGVLLREGIKANRRNLEEKGTLKYSETLLSFFLCKGTNPKKGKTYELHD